MIPPHLKSSEQKIIQAILFIISNAPQLNKYSLGKILYYIDARHFQTNQATITGKGYLHIERSPLPVGMNEILAKMVSEGKILVKPSIKDGKVQAMVFEALQPPDTRVFSRLEMKTLRTITTVLGRKIDDESRIFPRLYEHYIITDLFTEIDFSKLPSERPPKMDKKRKLIEIGDKIYKILFEGN